MISLIHASKVYLQKGHPPVSAVKDANLTITPGEFVVITGRSGSGKTTLLNLMAGLAQPTSGQVIIDGKDLWSLSDLEQSRLRNQKIGFVFQFPSLLQSLTVFEIVILPGMFGAGMEKRSIHQRAKELLEEVSLSDKLSAYPRQLSAGQQQRVVLARSLINQPDLLLADEPTSNLDEQTEKEVITQLQNIHAGRGITILLVTHAGQLIPCGTRALHMAEGMIIRDEKIQATQTIQSL
jgi:ABC-type lipoprotein export system ATPase subunit